jgi:hypothetical protein
MIRRILAAVAVVVVLVLVAFGVWANMVMQGERDAAIDVWTNPDVTVTSTDNSVVMTPTNVTSTNGLVFVPGAKVDPYAYMYKLSGLVESGLTVVITKPTLNLAFFDLRPLSTFEADAPEVTTWAVGGHSLGGVKACLLADDPTVTGLALFGSYCANDLSDTDLTVISIAGSEDGLSTPSKISDAAANLPADTEFIEIEGANHASFGDYGVQPGDGTATIADADMRDALTNAIVAPTPR